jgi:hypothetical protein
MGDIVMDDYQFLLQYGHNGKGGSQIHIGWLLAYTVAQAFFLLNSKKENM